MSNVTIRMDLYGDWIEYMRAALEAAGIQDVPPAPVSEAQCLQVALYFYGLHRRRIHAAPREVHRSRELSCPGDLTGVLAEIEQRSRAGDDLTPYLSRKLKFAPWNDLLLNDWGIHHLHLGSSFEPDGFIARTRPVLFVRVAEHDLYFIKVLPHGRGHAPWSDQDLVRILHENWPSSISNYRLNGVPPFSIDDAVIASLRKKNAQAPASMSDGTVYAGLGGGIMASGHNLDDIVRHDRCRKLLQEFQNDLAKQQTSIVAQLREAGIAAKFPLRCRLSITTGIAHIVECSTLTSFYQIENFPGAELPELPKLLSHPAHS